MMDFGCGAWALILIGGFALLCVIISLINSDNEKAKMEKWMEAQKAKLLRKQAMDEEARKQQRAAILANESKLRENIALGVQMGMTAAPPAQLLIRQCSRCEEKNPASARFCKRCGGQV